jgi:hypothetical protein
LFVGSGSSLQSGGPASLLLGFIIIGVMLLCTVQALGELAVLYPVNGACEFSLAGERRGELTSRDGHFGELMDRCSLRLWRALHRSRLGELQFPPSTIRDAAN